MEECQETLEVTVGEDGWSRAGLLGASAMLIREEHECRPKAQVLSPFSMDENISLKVKDLCPWCVQLESGSSAARAACNTWAALGQNLLLGPYWPHEQFWNMSIIFEQKMFPSLLPLLQMWIFTRFLIVSYCKCTALGFCPDTTKHLNMVIFNYLLR